MAEPALPFGLQLEGGQAALSLERPVWVGYGRIDRLLIRWPDVRYPFDLGSRMRQLKRLRGRLAEFEVVIAPGRLAETLDERAVAKYGISGLELQRVEGRMQLAFQAEIAGRVAEVTVPVTPVLVPGGRLRLRFEVPRVYGWLPLPAPLLLAGLAAAPRVAGWPGAEPPLVRFPELAGWELDVRELVLLALLPVRGWRLPERGRVELVSVEVGQEGVRVHLAEGGPAPGPEVPDEATRLLEDGDAALMAGESRPALEAYRQAAALDPEREAAWDRILSLLSVAGDPAALEAEARPRAEAAPGAVWPALGRAAAAAERGRQAEAAALYQALADELGRQGQPYDRACALAAAAAAMERAGQTGPASAHRSAAIAVLDDAEVSGSGSLGAGLRGRLSLPGGGPAGELAEPGARATQLGRARTAWQEGRLDDSARHHEALLGAPAGDTAAAESHLRLAQWARLQGQVATATRHLNRALRGEPASGAAADVLIEVLEAFGRTEELVEILRQRLLREEHDLGRRELTRALGAVLERAGRAGEAVALYREGLGRGDDDALTLTRLAELFRRESRKHELRDVLEPLFQHLAEAGGGRVVDEVEAGVDLETVAVELAALHAEAAAGRERAREILERTLALRPNAQEARQALEALGPANPAAGAD